MKNRKAVFKIMITAGLFSIASNAMAAIIPIANASFELPAQGQGGFTDGSITSWTVTGTTGVFRPDPSQLPTPSDGVQVGYTNGGTASQILGSLLTAGTHYTFQVDFSARKDCCTFIGAEIDFMAGSDVVASNQLASLAGGAVQTLSVSYDAATGNPLLGQALQVRIMNTGTANSGQIDFDNARLDATQVATGVPEPGTLILAGGGILAFILTKRRRA